MFAARRKTKVSAFFRFPTRIHQPREKSHVLVFVVRNRSAKIPVRNIPRRNVGHIVERIRCGKHFESELFSRRVDDLYRIHGVALIKRRKYFRNDVKIIVNRPIGRFFGQKLDGVIVWANVGRS